MLLKIYKGFSLSFLNQLDEKKLLDGPIEEKIDVTFFNDKFSRKLNQMLASMEDDDEKWVTYEEYALIHDDVYNFVKKYGLKVVCIYNNLYPDCYPISSNQIPQSNLDELLSLDSSNSIDPEDALTKRYMEIYSSFFKISDSVFATYYNYEYDDSYEIEAIPYYSTDIEIIKDKIDYDITFVLNDNLDYFIEKYIQIISNYPQTIGVKWTNSKMSKRILETLQAYCKLNNVKLCEYFEEISSSSIIYDDLRKIAKDDLKIPNFTDFRKVKFYKEPDISNDVIEISQAQIIKDIINQAEKAHNNIEGDHYRDIFITASTGAGKSVMFQVPAVYLAKKYNKLTIIIEPVIALMEDQVTALKNRGFNRVAAYNSNLTSQVEKEQVLNQVKNGDIDLLYLSPETLLSYSLETLVGDRQIGLLIVDEAHIVSAWGQGFRPDYWYLGGYINNVRTIIQSGHHKDQKPQQFPICAFTATAINGGIDNSVDETIKSLCMDHAIKYMGYVVRDDIAFNITVKETKKISKTEYEEKKKEDLFKAVAKTIKEKEKSVVYFPYASNVTALKKASTIVKYAGVDAKFIGEYVGRNTNDVSDEEFRLSKQKDFEDFRTGKKPIMFATKAFGMGVDINDIKYVYHYAASGNLSDYIQEIGRAARKESIKGIASTDFYQNDILFMEQLFGMSQIRQYQIRKVLSGVYDAYKNKGNRNFLISPQDFAYIFNTKGKEDVAITNLKTSLLMLEKDFFDKYNFKVLISRPRSVFTTAYVAIQKDKENFVLTSKYKKYFKKVAEGRVQKPVIGKKTKILISDVGDIFSINLKEIWEDYYANMSFPKFKYYYFKYDRTNTSLISKVIPEIINYIYPRQKVSVKSKNGVSLDQIRLNIYKDIDYITDILHNKFYRQFFSANDLSVAIANEYGSTKAKIIANSLFDVIDPHSKVVTRRVSEDGLTQLYFVNNGTLDSVMKKPIAASNIVKDFINNESLEYEQYMSVSDNDDFRSLKILSMFDYISFETIGGEEPSIFIRLNDPLKIKGILNGSIMYVNDYVTKAKEKHNRDVKILHKFFTELSTDAERWEFVEKYFLGYDVLKDYIQIPNEIELSKCIDEAKSYLNPSLKWKELLDSFDDYNTRVLVEKFIKYSIPQVQYLSLKFKSLSIQSPCFAWVDKEVMIFDDEASQDDINTCISNGWKAYKINDVDVEKLLDDLK